MLQAGAKAGTKSDAEVFNFVCEATSKLRPGGALLWNTGMNVGASAFICGMKVGASGLSAPSGLLVAPSLSEISHSDDPELARVSSSSELEPLPGEGGCPFAVLLDFTTSAQDFLGCTEMV